MSAAKPTLVVRCPGRKPVRMGPGETIRIGRHASNDLVLADDTVSRFHAVIGWDVDEDRPHVVDNESANGVEVDGDLIEVKSHLPGGNQVVIGRFTLVVEVTGLGDDRRREDGSDVMVPELNDSDSVVLYTEKRDQLTGRASSSAELHRVLLELEEKQRTGTLTVRGTVAARVTFCQGLVMTAIHGQLAGREALREVLVTASAIYGFTRELRPVDDPLNLSVRAYLETELADMTRKVVLRRAEPAPSGQDGPQEPPTRSHQRPTRPL